MKTINTTLLAAAVLAAALTQTHAASSDVDLTFYPGSSVNGFVRALAVQPDGKVLIGGDFTTVYDAMRAGVARLNADGTVDQSFIAGVAGPISSYPATPTVASIALQSDGKILIGGVFESVNGTGRTNLARLNVDGSLDESFSAGITYGNIDNILLANDGILIQGGFIWFNGIVRTNLARLHADGSLDGGFMASVAGQVFSVALQNDGKILIGGTFTAVSGIAQTNLARLNADGSFDSSFIGTTGPSMPAGMHTEPSSIAVQSDGKIVIAGYFNTVNGVAKAGIARLNTDGTLDDSFVGGLRTGPANKPILALQADGRILVGGNIYVSENGVTRAGLARLNIDGSLDPSFFAPMAPPVDDYPVLCIVSRDEGQVLAGGGVGYLSGATVVRYFCQLASDGSPDYLFGWSQPTGPDDRILSVTTQPDGRVLIGGAFASISGTACGHVARLMADGSLDHSFLNGVAGANYEVDSVAVQSDGQILIGGAFTMVNGVARGAVARLNTDGTLDGSFLNGLAGANNQVFSIAIQRDGKILIGGGFTSANGVARNKLARLNSDGSLDSSFLSGLGFYDTVQSIALQSDGQILIGGSFASVNGVPRFGLARLNPDGSLDTTFVGDLGPSSYAYGLLQQGDGRILVAGSFISVNGIGRANLARLNSNGALDTSFLYGLAGPNGTVASLALQGHGKVLIGGYFTKINGVDQSHLALLNSDGKLDPSFVVTTGGADYTSGAVQAIALQQDAKILIGGDFTVVNQTPRGFVARLVGESLAPQILIPPQSQTAEIGSSTSFSVVAVGFPALSYQWFFNQNTPIGGLTTNSFLELYNIQTSHIGSYLVVVTNAAGAITSAPAMLNVIQPVERRIVPAVKMIGAPGSLLHLEYTDTLEPPHNWQYLFDLTLTDVPGYYFELMQPLPLERYIRVRQTAPVSVNPDCQINMVPALTLSGDLGQLVRVDYINREGPIDAWMILDTVTLTNTTQLYFDVTAPNQPVRLYRQVPLP